MSLERELMAKPGQDKRFRDRAIKTLKLHGQGGVTNFYLKSSIAKIACLVIVTNAWNSAIRNSSPWIKVLELQKTLC